MTRLRIATFALVVSMAVICSSAPAPVPDPVPGIDNTQEIIEIIAPTGAAQETLESLNLGEPNSEQSERNKRTIGILRQLFPNLSQIVDRKIQGIISFLIRTVGRTILSSAIGGGNNGGSSAGGGGNAGGKVSVSLPTYSPDDDDDSDEDEDGNDTKKDTDTGVANRFGDESSTAKSTTPTSDSNEVQASTKEASSERSFTDILSTPPDSVSTTEKPIVSSTTLSIPTSTEPNPTTLSVSTSDSPSVSLNSTVTPSTSTLATAAVNADENSLNEAESQHSEVRVQFTDNEDKKSEEKDDSSSDQESAASGGNNGALDDLSLDDSENSDENRNKRFLSFGGGDSQASASGGSGGGSGNFLFDIIRRPAESAARAAGQVFRILTGTDSIGLGITASHTAVRDVSDTYTNTLNNASRLLVAGSGQTEQTDEAASAPHDGDAAKGDGYTEGIPGPVTRLFIIANRGIANLIQDLILRIAQTSERIVNFKARLITSII